MYKGYKIRLYPTKEQERKFWKHIAASRFIYNYMLDEQLRRYGNGEKYMYPFDMNRAITLLKKKPEFEWLSEVSSATLCLSCEQLHNAFKMFFAKKAKFPKHKSRKRSKPVFFIRNGIGRFYFKNNTTVMIPSVGSVKYKTDFDIPLGNKVKFTKPTITNVCGKWILAFNMEIDADKYNLTNEAMGIDIGIKELAVVSLGNKSLIFHNINKSKKIKDLTKRLKFYQRSVSKKYEANKCGKRYVKTNNIIKQEKKIAKICAKISNIRLNYIHQTTHSLVSLLPYKVVMEDLDVVGLMKNKVLSTQIQGQSFFEFKRQMQYKCEWRGIEFVLADRFYPSSKTCSKCGNIKKDLKLSDRTYVCRCCGNIIDRDLNAAINLAKYVVHS